MGATLADISRKAGVSITTVSKVLTGKGSLFRISKGTQEKIRRIARELDYSPDLHARSLRAGRYNQIGIVVTHFNDLWYGRVIHGLESVLVQNDYGFVINSVEDDPTKLAMRINRMRANRIEGLILVGSRLELPNALAQTLRKAGMPVVLVNRASAWPWVSSITYDQFHIGTIATQHLVDLGHRRIGMLLGPPNDPASPPRVNAYRAVLRSIGQEADQEDLEQAEPQGGFDSCRNGYEAVKNLLRRRPDLTGVFAFNDGVAVGAMRAVVEMGLRVPQDISIVGVDDASHGEYFNPPLTTVRLPTALLGEVAAERVLEILASDKQNERTVNLELKGTLAVRQSTGPVPSAPGREA